MTALHRVSCSTLVVNKTPAGVATFSLVLDTMFSCQPALRLKQTCLKHHAKSACSGMLAGFTVDLLAAPSPSLVFSSRWVCELPDGAWAPAERSEEAFGSRRCRGACQCLPQTTNVKPQRAALSCVGMRPPVQNGHKLQSWQQLSRMGLQQVWLLLVFWLWGEGGVFVRRCRRQCTPSHAVLLRMSTLSTLSKNGVHSRAYGCVSYLAAGDTEVTSCSVVHSGCFYTRCIAVFSSLASILIWVFACLRPF
jgi:hypothetical protein